MRELSDQEKEKLLMELLDTDGGLIAYGHYAKKEIKNCERKARNLEFLFNHIKDKFPTIKF